MSDNITPPTSPDPGHADKDAKKEKTIKITDNSATIPGKIKIRLPKEEEKEK